MTVNVGNADRSMRALVGVILLGLALGTDIALFSSGIGQIVAIVVAIVMLGTAALRNCPLYTVFGIKTCKS